ncbi:MAG: hypothetical protein MPW15_21075 [Candidatus Manganitrophus sp.]|nr:hypothetical protein [Candidatus Manganitrophus sp.]
MLEPVADGFRNYQKAGEAPPAEELLLDRAQHAHADRAGDDRAGRRPARTGRRNVGRSKHGVLTTRPGALTNDFFVNLLDMGTEWKAAGAEANVYEGRDRTTGAVKWTGTAVDLVFGSNSELRAIAEVYAQRRCGGEVRPRLRRRLGQGDEPRPVRPGLTVA